jgi:hypothetical protein
MESIVLILGFCAIISFIAYRNSFFGLKLMAGMAWIAFVIYWKDNPAGSIVEGSGVHTAVMVVAIGFAFMMVLSGLGRGISRSYRRSADGFEIHEEGGFRMPDWLKNTFQDDSNPQERRRNADNDLAAYRQTLRDAYNPNKRRS